MSHFDKVMQFILAEEGGYVNDPNDPGGETKYGIAKRFHPTVDIAALTPEQAKVIYRRDYWDKMGLDTEPKFDKALLLMDCAVNQGVARAKEIYASPKVVNRPFVEAFQAERALRYAALSTFQQYGRGWFRRLIRGAVEASK